MTRESLGGPSKGINVFPEDPDENRDYGKRPSGARRYRIVLRLLLWGSIFLSGYALAHYHPFFIFDAYGHCTYGVRGEKGAAALVAVCADNGFKASGTFDAGPTHQTVMQDQRLVFTFFDGAIDESSQNAPSLVVSDPQASAERAAAILKKAGFTAIIDSPIPDKPQLLVRVQTNAMVNSCLVFRRHVLIMGKPAWRPVPTLDK